MKMDTHRLLCPGKCYLEDTVFTRQIANFFALTSFLQCSCVCVMSCPWSQVLVAVKCSETNVALTHPSCKGWSWLQGAGRGGNSGCGSYWTVWWAVPPQAVLLCFQELSLTLSFVISQRPWAPRCWNACVFLLGSIATSCMAPLQFR